MRSTTESASACSPSAAARHTWTWRTSPSAPATCAISRRAGSLCRPRRSCSSTRTPAPPRSSAPAATPRSPSASTSASPSSGATDPEENPWGLSFLRDASTWPTTRVCSARASEGDVLPLYEAKMVHHFDHRLGTYEGQTEAQANMGTLPRLTRRSKNDPTLPSCPDTGLIETEVDSRLAKRGWDKDGCSAGATLPKHRRAHDDLQRISRGSLSGTTSTAALRVKRSSMPCTRTLPRFVSRLCCATEDRRHHLTLLHRQATASSPAQRLRRAAAALVHRVPCP